LYDDSVVILHFSVSVDFRLAYNGHFIVGNYNKLNESVITWSIIFYEKT